MHHCLNNLSLYIQVRSYNKPIEISYALLSIVYRILSNCIVIIYIFKSIIDSKYEKFLFCLLYYSVAFQVSTSIEWCTPGLWSLKGENGEQLTRLASIRQFKYVCNKVHELLSYSNLFHSSQSGPEMHGHFNNILKLNMAARLARSLMTKFGYYIILNSCLP